MRFYTMKTNGRGSIVQLEPDKERRRCRKWQLRVSVGMDPRTGRYRQRTRTFKGTYTEAQAALRDFISELDGAPMPSKSVPTFEQCADEWLRLRTQSKEVTPATVGAYKTRLGILARHLGKARVDKLTPEDVSNALTAMMDGDTPSGKPASPIYVKQLWIAGKTMYAKHAVKFGYAPSNPFLDVPLPIVEDREPTLIDEAGRDRILTEFRPVSDARHMGVLLALLAGLRLGECCNDLAWKDWSGTLLTVNGTKTKASKATVPICQELQGALAEWKSFQAAGMARYGLGQTPGTPIVTTAAFEPMPKDSLTVWWLSHRDALGFPGVRFHDLRHSFVSRCCRLGLHPKVVQRLARHANFSITMDIYTHLNMADLEKAVESL